MTENKYGFTIKQYIQILLYDLINVWVFRQII